jgi:inositol phosphorylceramide mannosyltransferase catalytic subunit
VFSAGRWRATAILPPRCAACARDLLGFVSVIPHILHQIWVGPDPFPEEFARYQETWLRHHPEWELRFWTEENLPADVRRPEVLERLRTPAERSDVLRLDVLWNFGGVYLDTDFECRRPIDDLIDGADFFIADLKPGRPNNAVIGAVAQHPILDRALREARFREFIGYDKAGTGPLFLNTVLKDYPDIKVFPPPAFYPATPAEREEAVAIHHAARSWQDATGFRAATLRAEQRLADAQRELHRTQRRLEAAERKAAGLRRSPLDRLRGIVGARRS